MIGWLTFKMKKYNFYYLVHTFLWGLCQHDKKKIYQLTWFDIQWPISCQSHIKMMQNILVTIKNLTPHSSQRSLFTFEEGLQKWSWVNMEDKYQSRFPDSKQRMQVDLILLKNKIKALDSQQKGTYFFYLWYPSFHSNFMPNIMKRILEKLGSMN